MAMPVNQKNLIRSRTVKTRDLLKKKEEEKKQQEQKQQRKLELKEKQMQRADSLLKKTTDADMRPSYQRGTGNNYYNPNMPTKKPEEINDRSAEKSDRKTGNIWNGLQKKKATIDDLLGGKTKKQTTVGSEEQKQELQKRAAKLTGAQRTNILDPFGQYGRGNIDLNSRKVVKNPDGSISTEKSFSTNIDGKEVLLPTIINGKEVSEDEAIRNYKETGENLGKFDTPAEATAYAQMLHLRQEDRYGKKPEEKQNDLTRGVPYYTNPQGLTFAMDPQATDTFWQGRPEDYWDGNNREDYDRVLYDYLHGDGAYEQRINELETDEDVDALESEIGKIWDSVENQFNPKEPRTFTKAEDQRGYPHSFDMPPARPFKDYVGDVKIGGQERPQTMAEMYENADPKLRGQVAKQATGMKLYRDWLNKNPFVAWANLAEDRENWQNVQKDTEMILDENYEALGEALNEDEWEPGDPIYDNMINEIRAGGMPDVISNPVRNEKNDRALMDFYYGDGFYDEWEGDPEREEKLQELWAPIEDGTLAEYRDRVTGFRQMQTDTEYAQSMNRTAEKQLKNIERLEGQKAEYNELINQYDDNITMPDYNPEYDKGYTDENIVRADVRSNDPSVNNDIDRIASFIGGGNELKAYAKAFGDEGGNFKVRNSYKYAMMMTDGSNGSVDEIGMFLNLYNQAKAEGREPTEAMAFLDGLQATLRARYSDAEKIDTAELARKYPVVASAMSIAAQNMNVFLDIPRHVAEWAGDESVKDANSWWYRWGRQANQIQGTIANDIGGFGGKIYLNVMNSLRNMTRGLMTARLSGLAQQIVGLGSFFLEVDQEATGNYLEQGYDYDTAKKFGAIDGAFEVLQEFLPFETMLGSAGKSVWKSIANNMLSEFGQEFSGATWMEKIEGILKGEDSENARTDEIIAQQGYEKDGEWVDLRWMPKDTLMNAARVQAAKEFWQEAVESGLAGLFGGGLSGTYGSVLNVANMAKVGKNIRNEQNTVEGVTGGEQLVEAAAGMDGTESQQIAQDIQAKEKEGKRVTNYEIGKLAAKVAEEANEQIAKITRETVENRIAEQLKQKDVTGEQGRAIAEAMTNGLIEGKLTAKESKTIAGNVAAMGLWRSYNSVMSEDFMGLRQDVAKATEGVRSVAQKLGELTGHTARNMSQVSAEVDEALKGNDTVEGALDSLAKSAKVISARFAEEAKKRAKDNEGVKSYVDDATRIYLAAMSQNVMPKVSMKTEDAEGLFQAAQEEFAENDKNRILKQEKVTPGHGTATYDGVEYGTKEWEEKVNKGSGLHSRIKMQMNVLGYVAKQMGFRLNFVNRGGQEAYVHGWESADGSITVNIAGMQMSGLSKNMLATIWHELTHWLEQNSSEGYAKLRSFILGKLRSQGVSIENRLLEIMDNQNSVLREVARKQAEARGEEITEEKLQEIFDGQALDVNGAMAELVAQSCEELLNTEAVRNELAKSDPTVFGQVKAFVRRFIAQLNAALKGIDSSLSREAKALTKWKEEMAQLWLGAREEALGRATEEGAEATGERFSTASMDREYMEAVENGDIRRQRALVDQAAVSAGYTQQAYHGTTEFGFTQFDMEKSQGEIFVAYDNIDTASSYIDTENTIYRPRGLSTYGFDPTEATNEELAEFIKKNGIEHRWPEEILDVTYYTDEEIRAKVRAGEIKAREIAYDDDGVFAIRIKGIPNVMEDHNVYYTKSRALEELGANLGGNGIYDLYVNPGNELVIDADGADWNDIELTDPEMRDEFDEKYGGGNVTTRLIAGYAKSHGYDSVRINDVVDHGGRNPEAEAYGDIGVIFNERDVKSADPIVYDNDGNVIPLSERFNIKNPDIRWSVSMEDATHPGAEAFSVAQVAQANGLRFDEDEVILFNRKGEVIDGVKVKVTEEMIENTPIGMLINMARDGVTTKAGKVKFRSTISAETAKAQKKMFTDLMNMIARYRDSNLVWEIASSQLYSAMKSNSDPQYSTTVDFGTVCAKTQEIINVMSRVMLEKGRGLTREEVLMVYNETANAGLTVPCPVCYVFSRWMGVPSLLNQMSQYQKRFVVTDRNGKINKKATQAKVDAYIREAMDTYGSKAALDKAKTSILNRMKTQEGNRSSALVVLNSRNATAEEKQAAKVKHDEAVKNLDALTKDLGVVEAYNWVTQALCRETGKGSGKYVVDDAFELTPDSVLFDLRRTGEFAKYAKNWRYRNTRGAGMGKAIMPYSGETIGDIIYGTERKSEIKNTFLQMKAGGASNAMKNAIIRARKQNLIGGQRLQSTSDFRPEWGLDYIMTFLELQAIGSKVQMYTKVAEAVDLLASMHADVNLSIMGKGSGFHEATEEEIRESRKNTKRGRDLRSRMGQATDENGVRRTYVLDFSDITGMDYDTAKALKNKHDSVQMILVGMNDTHIRLAMQNPDIDFIIPWHSSGNSETALKSMISSVGEKLETSSDYTDTQSDKASENQTEAQKQLWELRMKILQGKALTAAEKKIVDADDWLADLWERFNVEGVDPDCYQVELGKEQAAQIFPYEYWDKGLKKEDARKNGMRFIEYCQHFGIVPRFSGAVKQNEDGTFTVTGNFAGAVYDEKGNITGYDPEKMEDGYHKVLIDRPMYDNNGNYREQQVVDVTKAKVGALDEKGNLKDSDMPMKTSAMYGDGYSAQEKNATDNTLAALDMKEQMEAIGSNVLNPKASAFGASQNVEILQTTAEETKEEIAPKKYKARYAEEDAARFSTAQPDMDVSVFMQGLNENSLSTEQERTMLRQYKELKGALDVAQYAVREQQDKIRKLEAKGKASAWDREQIRKANNILKNYIGKQERLAAEMAKVTGTKGFAKLMYEQEQVMRNLASGKTYEQVRAVVEQLTKRVEQMTKEMDARQKQIDEMRGDLAFKKRSALVNNSSAEKIAGMIRKDYGSDISLKELTQAIVKIRLKMATKQNIQEDVEELAWKIALNTKGEKSAVLEIAAGRTIVLGKQMMDELKGQHRTLKDVRKDLAGTGIKVRTGETGTLDGYWSEWCDLLADLDRDANTGDKLDELLRVIRDAKEAQANSGADRMRGHVAEAAEDLKAMIATVEMNTPKDPGAMKIIGQMNTLIDEMAGGVGRSTEKLEDLKKELAALVDQGKMALEMTDEMQRDIDASIKYNNALTEQSEAAMWKKDKIRLIEQLKNENTEKLVEEQQKWKARIEKDKNVQKMMADNARIRRQIHTNITRMKKLMINETDQKNIPEHMKSLARQVLGMIVKNDLGGRKITGIDRKDLQEMQRVLGVMEDTDGLFTLDDLKMIADEEAQSIVADALADIEDGISFYNASLGKDIIANLQGFKNSLTRVAEAVASIKNIIDAERTISDGDRKILVADAAEEIAEDMEKSRFKGETRGRGSRQINMAKKAVYWGNLTPVYFFRNLKNRGMSARWKNFAGAENRNGLELQKAEAYIAALARETHYRDWTGQKVKVTLGGRQMEITVDQIQSLYAVWKREHTSNPEMSNHLEKGGVFFDVDDGAEGKLRKEKIDMRPVRMDDAAVQELYNLLTEEQKQYIEGMVKYLSNEMSELGNEASMRMYGIKKYKEKWYFPMQVWDGVKSARSDRGISGTTENRAAQKSWSKRRKNNASNALVIGDFTQTAVNHIVEMINYNTMAPEIENMNKILNYQRIEFAEDGDPYAGSVKRNMRVMFQEAYGKQALEYLETFMKDLNGGTVQDQRKTLREAALAMFKKNAVAGSLSVTLQQPLSYIRAAMMISSKYLVKGLTSELWKHAHDELMKYSGVAVIKEMGRFDMNFGRSAKDFVSPDKKESVYEKVSDKLTVLPEMADRMTWTRMWVAVKLEQQALHPEMDVKSEKFLKLAAERFNEVMRATQVYDSVLVKSSNMRSQKFTMKVITSFMAEPTLSLNVLADAVRNAVTGEEGGKKLLGRAFATFMLSAAAQAFFKGLMGSGRSPDDKKTWEENFLYKWWQNFLNEGNVLSLVPGYSDIIEVIKTGELSDDAMGAIGKIFTTFDTASKAVQGKGKGWYRDLEDTAAQLAQLFTNIPAKNIMRDLRAMYNYISQEPYAKRPTNANVLREQITQAIWTSDSLLGAINAKLGDAGYKTTNEAYYQRIYQAKKEGNEQRANDLIDYLLTGKNVKRETIDSGVAGAAKKDTSTTAEEKAEFLIAEGMNAEDYIRKQMREGELNAEEARKLLQKAQPEKSADDVWWQVDRIEYQLATGAEKTPGGYYYRLTDAINNGKSDGIRAAVKELKEHGISDKQIRDKLSDWKSAYLEATGSEKVRIKNALIMAYKTIGISETEANNIINKWKRK